MNDGFLGAKGILNERGVFTGSCIGDSGGPLMAQNEDDRRTLIGIVSGKLILVWLVDWISGEVDQNHGSE